MKKIFITGIDGFVGINMAQRYINKGYQVSGTIWSFEDSEEIKNVVESHGGKCFLSSKNHINGTERIAEVAKRFDYDLIVDIQGDEPFIDYKHIDKVIEFHLKNDNLPWLSLYAIEQNNVSN